VSAFATFGSPVRKQRVYCGPSLGWIDAPIFPEIVVTGDHVVQPYESVLLLQLAAPATITLPDVVAWLNRVGPDGPIYIKDIGGNVGSNNVTITGAQTIDGLPTAKLAANFALVTIRPRPSGRSARAEHEAPDRRHRGPL
jgi:hypothetical protein